MILDTINVYLFKLLRPLYNRKLQRKLKNKEFSLLCNNCTGGIIYHDLGVKFNTPFINVGVHYKDFIKMCCDLPYYMSLELVESFEDGIEHPMGELEGIKLYFPHDATFADAKANWDKRRVRIDYDNIYMLLGQHLDGEFEIDELMAFNAIPYKKRVLLPHEYEGIQDGIVLKDFLNTNGEGDINTLHVVSPTKRTLDQFDFVEWLNS